MAFSGLLKRKIPSTLIGQETPSGHSELSQDEKNTDFFVNKNNTWMGNMEINLFEHLKSSNQIIQNQRVQTSPFLAIPTIVVHLIFLICKQLNQPPNVRYLAVELFDRFSYFHYTDLSNKIWLSSNIQEPKKQWEKVMHRVRSQILLRLLSCIEIASKFIVSDNDKVVRGRTVQKFLRAAGKAYTLSSILSSEIRVFRTLGYKIHIPTALVYSDFLIETLNLAESINPSELLETSISVSDIAYLHHQEIYHKLHYISTGCWERTDHERLNFLPIECNGMYLACAVILTTINILLPDQEEIAAKICKQLDQLTNVPAGDIEALTAIIMEQIVIT